MAPLTTSRHDLGPFPLWLSRFKSPEHRKTASSFSLLHRYHQVIHLTHLLSTSKHLVQGTISRSISRKHCSINTGSRRQLQKGCLELIHCINLYQLLLLPCSDLILVSRRSRERAVVAQQRRAMPPISGTSAVQAFSRLQTTPDLRFYFNDTSRHRLLAME